MKIPEDEEKYEKYTRAGLFYDRRRRRADRKRQRKWKFSKSSNLESPKLPWFLVRDSSVTKKTQGKFYQRLESLVATSIVTYNVLRPV